MPHANSVSGYGPPTMGEDDKEKLTRDFNLQFAGKAPSKADKKPQAEIKPRTAPNTHLELAPKRAGVISNKVYTIAKGNTPLGVPATAAIGLQIPMSYRIYALLISQIRPTKDLSFAEFTVHKNALWQAIGADPYPSLEEVERVMTNLAGGVFVVSDERKFAVMSYMQYCKFDRTTGLCQLRFNPEVSPYLRLDEPRDYRKIHFQSVCRLWSAYSAELYMFLRRFVGRDYSPTPTNKERTKITHEVSYSTLRMILQVDDRHYARHWSEFNHDVLRPAIADINKYTELIVKYTVKRSLKAQKRGPVHSICFSVTENKRMISDLGKRKRAKAIPDLYA